MKEIVDVARPTTVARRRMWRGTEQRQQCFLLIMHPQ
jgi:hypothetical protein